MSHRSSVGPNLSAPRLVMHDGGPELSQTGSRRGTSRFGGEGSFGAMDGKGSSGNGHRGRRNAENQSRACDSDLPQKREIDSTLPRTRFPPAAALHRTGRGRRKGCTREARRVSRGGLPAHRCVLPSPVRALSIPQRTSTIRQLTQYRVASLVVGSPPFRPPNATREPTPVAESRPLRLVPA